MDMEKRFIQKTAKAEAMKRIEDMKQLENETNEQNKISQIIIAR